MEPVPEPTEEEVTPSFSLNSFLPLFIGLALLWLFVPSTFDILATQCWAAFITAGITVLAYSFLNRNEAILPISMTSSVDVSTLFSPKQ